MHDIALFLDFSRYIGRLVGLIEVPTFEFFLNLRFYTGHPNEQAVHFAFETRLFHFVIFFVLNKPIIVRPFDRLGS